MTMCRWMNDATIKEWKVDPSLGGKGAKLKSIYCTCSFNFISESLIPVRDQSDGRKGNETILVWRRKEHGSAVPMLAGRLLILSFLFILYCLFVLSHGQVFDILNRPSISQSVSQTRLPSPNYRVFFLLYPQPPSNNAPLPLFIWYSQYGNAGMQAVINNNNGLMCCVYLPIFPVFIIALSSNSSSSRRKTSGCARFGSI